MKNIIYLIIAIIISSLLACSKESEIIPSSTVQILEQSISGLAYIDEDDDGVGDSFLEGARIYLGENNLIQEIKGERPDTLDAPYNEILWADVNEDGEYLFAGLQPMDDSHLVLYYHLPTKSITGTDNTPDGDTFETELSSIIFVGLDEDENDDGNDWVVQLVNIDGAISGNIKIDINKDGIIDGPLEGAKLWLSRRSDMSGGPIGLALDNTHTDEFGNYHFENVVAGEYTVAFANVVDYEITDAGDESPDNDLGTTYVYWIPVDISDGEHDADNNFYAIPKWYNATGYVMEDTNQDGVGDVPISGERVEIYKRDANGLPEGSFVAWSPSDVNGYFRFQNLPPEDYVIQLKISSDFECVSATDESPEPAEPTDNGDCTLIQTDVPFQDSEDDDNIFTLKRI